MMQSTEGEPAELTRLLDAWSAGERGALDRLAPLVQGDLRRLAGSLMGRQAASMTLQPTALVNEAYLRLAEGRQLCWESRLQFYAYAVTTMRRILVNHVRDRHAAKRGGMAVKVSLDQISELPALGAPVPSADLLDLDRALRGLAALDPRQARIVELRYFGGLSVEETALALVISPRTVKREWFSARLFLLRALGQA